MGDNHRVTERTETTNDIFRREYDVPIFKYW
jgi:hypothetical protein